jgi:signal transduction histidine kinase
MTERGVPEGPVEVRRLDEASLVRRRQLEQQLHDGPAHRLAALSLRLGLFSHQASGDNHALRKCLDEVQAELHTVLQELRNVASQIYPPVLAAAGLGAAFEAMAEQHGIPIIVYAPEERYNTAVEDAAYFAVAERLLSLGRGSPTVTVTIRRTKSELLLKITTDDDTDTTPITVRIRCE